EGDENTKFFHGIINKRRNNLTIRGIIVDGGNSSFIALIPKTQGANKVNDFRPIGLIGSLYKIITKLLANRLAFVFNELVSDVQYAFISKRHILDGPFILNEVIHWCKAKKNSMIFKVDFEKAFDSVRWDFLEDVMKNFGFGHRWCDWIMSCLKSSKGLVLVSGSPTSEFQFYKGLKQGDPLLPFLFILFMETLHLSFDNVVKAGLRINIHKSKLMGVTVEHDLVKPLNVLIRLSIPSTPAVSFDRWSAERANFQDFTLDYDFAINGLKVEFELAVTGAPE
nr:RNA-directed DNA polymerase, eukaryota, reverse transcriptase zinc-binding domain protein [Tanacetum cinerariifolium]